MKTLEFNDINKESYDMIYEVVRAYPVKGIDEILKAATIVEKLKEVGVEKGDNRGDFKAYKLKAIPTVLELEDDYFRYVKNAFENTPMATSVKIELLAQTAKLLKQADAG
jgi:hypothetical protein